MMRPLLILLLATTACTVDRDGETSVGTAADVTTPPGIVSYRMEYKCETGWQVYGAGEAWFDRQSPDAAGRAAALAAWAGKLQDQLDTVGPGAVTIDVGTSCVQHQPAPVAHVRSYRDVDAVAFRIGTFLSSYGLGEAVHIIVDAP